MSRYACQLAQRGERDREAIGRELGFERHHVRVVAGVGRVARVRESARRLEQPETRRLAQEVRRAGLDAGRIDGLRERNDEAREGRDARGAWQRRDGGDGGRRHVEHEHDPVEFDAQLVAQRARGVDAALEEREPLVARLRTQTQRHAERQADEIEVSVGVGARERAHAACGDRHARAGRRRARRVPDEAAHAGQFVQHERHVGREPRTDRREISLGERRGGGALGAELSLLPRRHCKGRPGDALEEVDVALHGREHGNTSKEAVAREVHLDRPRALCARYSDTDRHRALEAHLGLDGLARRLKRDRAPPAVAERQRPGWTCLDGEEVQRHAIERETARVGADGPRLGASHDVVAIQERHVRAGDGATEHIEHHALDATAALEHHIEDRDLSLKRDRALGGA